MVKLKDILKNSLFTDGDWVESKDQDPDGDIRLIQLADIGDGFFVNKSSKFINKNTAKRLNCTFLQKGDVLIARMPDPLGRACIFPLEGESKFITVVDVCIIRGCDDIDNNYLKYTINSPSIRSEISRQSTGTTRTRISRKNIGNLEIPLPPLAIQKHIADILDAADALRRKTQQIVDSYDELAQSLFLEMFGDPVSNPKKFPVKKLSDFYINPKEGTKCGPFGSALKRNDFIDNGIPVWNMDNITKSGSFIDTPNLYISQDTYEKLKSFEVFDNDIIISRAGTVGKMCIVKSIYRKSIISTNLIRLRLGAKLSPLFFVCLMNYGKGRVGRLKKGGDDSFTHMNTGILDSLNIYIPPLDLQKLFAEKIALIEQQKELAKQSLAESENLFNALLQKAFKGELVPEPQPAEQAM